MINNYKIAGLMVDAPKYSPTVKELVIQSIQSLRTQVLLPDESEKGSRFHSDNHVLWLLESNIPQQEIIDNTFTWVLMALIEAARSDHWYNTDKDFDYHNHQDDDDDSGYDYDIVGEG